MSRYMVKVKKSQEKTYLWGGKEVQGVLESPLFLTFRVVDMGEKIKFGTSKPGSPSGALPQETPLGSLQENETFTIQLKGISGIWAICSGSTDGGSTTVDGSVDTKVECFIESTQSSD
jgi:hypothetical protein